MLGSELVVLSHDFAENFERIKQIEGALSDIYEAELKTRCKII